MKHLQIAPTARCKTSVLQFLSFTAFVPDMLKSPEEKLSLVTTPANFFPPRFLGWDFGFDHNLYTFIVSLFTYHLDRSPYHCLSNHPTTEQVQHKIEPMHEKANN